MNTTIAACSTAPGAGAIGIVRMSGPEAIFAADFFFHPKGSARFADLKPRTVYYGEFTDKNGQILDLCTAVFFKAPNSYTGEDIVEIDCHGSQALIAEILTCLFEYGVKPALPGEFTKRAFLNGKIDLASAEAVIDLITAQNAAAVKNAASQLKGSLGDKLKRVRQELLNLVSHFYAVVDFPDEGVDPFLISEATKTLISSTKQIEQLLRTYNRGRFLKEGIPVVILGKPNVGKSSLLNALCGEDKAIVTPYAGTTRDIVEAKLRTTGSLLSLMDTAGIRESGEEIEKIGITRSKQAVEKAQFAIAVFDGSRPLDENDREVIDLCRQISSIAVVNKSDLIKKLDLSQLEKTFEKIVEVSAKTGDGLSLLEEALSEKTGLNQDFSDSLITNIRQAEALRGALDRLTEASNSIETGITPDAVVMDIEGALFHLGEITGETVKEEIISNIFSRFCVGK
ncbi:MAG: tRNA uridine-5-carboxymethylaminomethyl(34) synthesis GTPase MnmE [Clostridiales bacterium]|nr:tRNA uridine-5-carboxymethylaminomethyl(34) synthesis GTPase MnmE [Clostridiales bacterium]